MQNKEHLRAMEKTWVDTLSGKHDYCGGLELSNPVESRLESSAASMPFLLAFTQQGKRCTQILALNIYEGILGLPPGILLPQDTYYVAVFWYSSGFLLENHCGAF